MQDLTPRAKDSLVSFGERLATRIFASYLRTQVSPLGTSHTVSLLDCRVVEYSYKGTGEA
jgi:aspartokinase